MRPTQYKTQQLFSQMLQVGLVMVFLLRVLLI